MSQISQDYSQIVTGLLNNRRDWQDAPEIVYFTLKAMYQQQLGMEQLLHRNQEILTEQGIRIRELSLELENNNHIESGFKKSKRKEGKSKILSRSHSRREHENSYNSHRMNQESSLDAVEEIANVKDVVQELMADRNKQLEAKLNEINSNMRQQQAKRFEDLQRKTAKETVSFKQNCLQEFHIKLQQIEAKLSSKNQIQRTNIMKFVQDCAMQTEKLWLQTNNLHSRLSKFVQETKLPYSSSMPAVERTMQDRSRSLLQLNSSAVNMQNSNTQISQLRQQIKELKLQVKKQACSFIKAAHMEVILRKFQAEINDRVNKLTQDINQFEKQLQRCKKESLTKTQSKVLINSFKTVQNQSPRKDKSSQQSLKAIKESLEKLESHFKDKMKSFKKQLTLKMEKTVADHYESYRREISEELQFRQKSMCEIVQSNCDKLTQLKQNTSPGEANLRLIVDKLSQQMLLFRCIYLGDRHCKDFIEWSKSPCNLMEQNFIWRDGSPTVMVMSPGLYWLDAGLYPDNIADGVQSHIILNGEPISSFKGREVPIGTKSIARGWVFSEAVLLPGRSKICIRLDLPFFGQAYLQLRRL